MPHRNEDVLYTKVPYEGYYEDDGQEAGQAMFIGGGELPLPVATVVNSPVNSISSVSSESNHESNLNDSLQHIRSLLLLS